MIAECDKQFMAAAILEARSCPVDEVPIGAIVVRDGKILSRACNLRQTTFDPTAHAEILALRQAGELLKRWNLSDCDIYVTLEPCAMCAGAILNARVGRVVFGATDSKFGALISAYNMGTDNKLNHSLKITSGIMQSECSQLLTNFFKRLRQTKVERKVKSGEMGNVAPNGDGCDEL